MSEAAAALKSVPQWRLALQDVRDGLRAHRVWVLLAKMDIRQRYRRSVLGPFWITLTQVIWILAIGPLYSRLMGEDPRLFIPYLAMGIITWSLVSSLLTEGAAAFVSAENLVRSVKLPYTVHILRVLYRNLIVFAHNLLAFVPFMLYLRTWPQWEWLLAVPGLALIVLAALPTSFLLGTLSARFRDLQQIIASIVQLAFFVTPIFWRPQLLGDLAWVAELNPFHLMLEAVRAPVVEGVPGWGLYARIGVLLLVLFLVCAPFFARYRRRVAFWV